MAAAAMGDNAVLAIERGTGAAAPFTAMYGKQPSQPCVLPAAGEAKLTMMAGSMCTPQVLE